MLTTLTLPALTLLLGVGGVSGVSGVPWLPWLHKIKLKHPPAVAADSLPPQWRTPSRLALQNRFVRAALPGIEPQPVGLKLKSDPRRLRVAIDPDSGLVSTQPELGQVPIGFAARQPIDRYVNELTTRSFQRQWAERTALYMKAQTTANAAAAANPVAGLSFKLPSPLPRRVQSLLGPGGPALNVSGSENIRLSGTSNWTNQQFGPLGRKPSLFPSLDMQQDLDIRLEGQLSDRIRVNLLQNSGIQIPLANRIAINYKGDEDDVVQALDLGNTNLSLPGTQYVSYSGKNEGLFGIKTALRLGPLDYTVLASKQEGKSERAAYAGGTSRQTQTLADLDYVKGTYFFLYDPNLDLLDIPNTSIQLFLDDYNYSNDQSSVAGRAFVDASLTCPGCIDSSSVRGVFTPMHPGADQDYEILDNVYNPRWKVIRLRRPVSGEQRLAVTYTARRLAPDGTLGPEFQVGGQDSLESDGATRRFMKLLRAPGSLVKPDASGNFDTTNVFVTTRDLELRNFYQLAGQRIDPNSFELTIRKGVDDPPVTFIRSRGDTAIPYIEVLGLDNFDQSRGGLDPGHDGKVDGTYATTDSRQLFVDFENGTLFFFDLRPFAPRVGRNFLGTDGQLHPRYPFDQFLSNVLTRRDSLVGPPDSANGANAAIYDKYYLQRALDARYFIDADFTAARAQGEINLGRGNLLEGSDVVTINGQALVRDRDYTIDYDLGRVTLKRQLGPADQLNIDYSYAPLFQQAGRTLVGSAFRLEGRDKSFGGAFMYESKGAQDLRPRIGEEPSRSLIGDLNTDWAFRPEWLTRLVDRLPGIRTTAPSDFRVQAEAGASFPNPNTRNVVYLDDMEGVRDAVTLSMSPERWALSSVPKLKNAGLEIPLTDSTIVPRRRKGELHWYSPPAAVKERDLKPNLSDAQGAQTVHQVMALSIPRRPLLSNVSDMLWAGLTFPLDQVGLDLSRSQFIEVWVNDFNDLARVRDRHVKVHVDLGVVSEDQMRSPDAPPNGRLDTEDQGSPPDRQLTVTDRNNEDTGFDQKLDADEIAAGARILDLTTAGGSDPEGDDFRTVPEGPPEDMDPARFRYANGTENNHTLNPAPDTEDLNLNNNLDTSEDFFEYTFDLCDTCRAYLVTDVLKDFTSPLNPVRADNGWRRYRIPINDAARVKFGVPDLTLARHVRVWVDSLVDPDPAGEKRPLLMLGGLEIVGNRWQQEPLTPHQNSLETTLTLNSLNNVDNADEYHAPFDPGTDRSGGLPLSRREQSLVLEFTGLPADDTLEVFKTFSIDEDYSRYGSLAFWTSGIRFDDLAALGDSVRNLQYFVRFASDERGSNYYEYKAPVPLDRDSTRIPWREIRIKLTDLSNLKLNYPTTDQLYRTSGPAGGDSVIIHGRPSFTRLRRISFGIINANQDTAYAVRSGRLLFDELRATDVAKDAGYAERMQVSGRLANLMSYSASWNARDANFQSVGENRGGGSSTDQLNVGANVDLHRFFEATGIVIPLGLNYARSSSRPRFTAGDDILRTGILEKASETRGETRSLSASYSRQWTERSNPFLRYTLGGITASHSRTESNSRNPTSVGNSLGRASAVNYGIAPRGLLPLKVPLTKLKFFPLPERAYWNYSVATSESRAFDRTRDGGLLLRNSIRGRSANVNFGADTRPFEFLHHHVEGVRNLMLRDDLREKIGFINLGHVVNWRQSMDGRFSLNRGPWLNPSMGWGTSFSQDNGPQLSTDLSVRSIANSRTLNGSWSLPFDRFTGRVSRFAPKDTAAAATRRSRWDWRSFAGRLGSFTVDASYNKSSSYSRLIGTPSFFYLTGLSDDPGLSGPRVRTHELFGNSENKSNDWRTSGRTRVALLVESSVMVRGELSGRRSLYNHVSARSVTSRFPDLEFDYGHLPTVLRIDRVLTNPRFRTAYSRSRLSDYRTGDKKPTRVATSSQWQPLLSLSGDFKNATRAEIKVERRVSVREDFQFATSTRTERNTDLNVNLSRSYTRGQKVKVLGRESSVRSSISLSLATVYSRTSGETKTVGSKRVQLPTDTDRLSINGTGNYSFSNNVSGGLVLGFGQNRNLQQGIVSRSVRVEFRASFTF